MSRISKESFNKVSHGFTRTQVAWQVLSETPISSIIEYQLDDDSESGTKDDTQATTGSNTDNDTNDGIKHQGGRQTCPTDCCSVVAVPAGSLFE